MIGTTLAYYLQDTASSKMIHRINVVVEQGIVARSGEAWERCENEDECTSFASIQTENQLTSVWYIYRILTFCTPSAEYRQILPYVDAGCQQRKSGFVSFSGLSLSFLQFHTTAMSCKRNMTLAAKVLCKALN